MELSSMMARQCRTMFCSFISYIQSWKCHVLNVTYLCHVFIVLLVEHCNFIAMSGYCLNMLSVITVVFNN